MNQLLRKFVLGCLPFFMVGAFTAVQGQSVFNPNDPIVIYNPANPPTEPVFGQPGKWVKTNRLSWNTSTYKAYIYKGIQFRLKFPKNYDGSGATKYPLFLFFHGKGERGSIYDNEYQLYHGGELHRNAVDNNNFNGFLLYPQNVDPEGHWTNQQRTFIAELIENFLVPQVNVDPFRISVDGLSAGGLSTWRFFESYPRLTAACLPISNASSSYNGIIVQNKFTPIWLFQGGLDQSPVPATSQYLNTVAQQAGANFTYTEYPNLGHGSWYAAWGEQDYFPFMTRAHKANPWPLNGRTEFCPGETINTTIGVTAGFNEYQWKNGETVLTGLGTTSNTLTVTAYGTYSCRIRKGTVWSPWSPIPVVIKPKTATIPPIVKVSGLASRVLPAPDGKTTVDLEVPSGYAAYNWQRVGNSTTLSTNNVITGATVGNYRVQVTEQFGCSSTFTDPFPVINANGPNKPDPASNLIVIPVSYTALKLNWSTNPAAPYPQTNFEIYEASQPGGPYHFVSLVPSNVYSFIREGLTPGVKYYYIVRAINNTAGANVSNEGSAATQKDSEPPTAPGNLIIKGTTRTSASLEWNESVDNVGLANYELYINGVKSYVSTGTEYTVYNLEYGKTYNFFVKAVDVAGNKSTPSNQVTTQALAKGLSYKHYIGTWDNLPDFNTINPIVTGVVANVTLTNSTQAENYAFLWEGYIQIPSDGNYIFQTRSDDGSKLYLAPYNNATTALVNNDFLQAATSRNSATTFLTAGVYPIAISYFQKGGGAEMGISWQKQGTGGWSMTPIPDVAFVDPPFPPAGVAPVVPSNLTATAISYKQINLSWTDNSNNEQSFEIFRSTDPMDNFTTVGVLPANASTFKDTLVAPATQYFYKIRAINQYGESAFDKTGPGVDYAYYEQTGMTVIPNFTNMTPVKTGRVPTFGLGMQLRGDNFAVKFDGLITITNPGAYTFFTSSDDGSRLYIDDILRVDHDGLHGDTEKAGTAFNLTAGVHTIRVTFFEAGGGETLVARYQGPGIPKQIIPGNVLGDILANATTLAAPPIPAAPSNLIAIGFSSSDIKLGWINNAINATKNEIYRSYNGDADYVLLATVPANATSYIDSALYPSSLFFYKIKAVGEGGSSPYSNEKSARTLGVVPSILPIENVYMRFNSQVLVPVEAVSGTPTTITLQVNNLPPFATFQQTGNGKGVITFNPAESNQGVYANIIVTAANPQNDMNTAKFNLTVNSNYVPHINTIANVSVNEKQTAQINLSATDADATDQLVWTFTGLPSFATVTGSNRTAKIAFAPNYGQAGVYNVKARVNDGRNGIDTSSFTITVVHVNNPNPNDGTVPIKPGNIAVQFDNNLNAVKVTWTNAAYNATRNEVYRSTSAGGGYVLLNPGATNKDSTSYLDYTAAGNKTYFYLVKAVNANGGSNSEVVRITTPNRAPVIADGGDIYAKSSTPIDVTISATDDPGDVVGLSMTNLPSFATFSDNGNGSGIIHLAPTGTHIGTYEGIIVKATDNYGAVSSKTVKIIVTDKDITSVFVNFNDISNPAPFPWNNFNISVTPVPSTARLTNLKTETNQSTPISIGFDKTWNLTNTSPTTGNNSGVFPDQVIKTGFYGGGTKKMTISGLDDTKKYNLVFFGNRNVSGSLIAEYSVGVQTAVLNIAANTTATTQLNGLTSSGGIINVNIRLAGGADGSTAINAMVIQSYSGNIFFPPFNLKMVSSTKNAIKLSWKSNATNVSAFEVWRSDSQSGTYVKLPGTIPGNTFTYTDAGLPAGTLYYYKVRTVSGSNSYSDYSDVVSAATISYAININFNDGSNVGPAQPAPWNNINELLNTGFTINDLLNDNGQNTGINLSLIENFSSFSGTNRQDNTMTTGNNSGVVPDIVMSTFYFLNYGTPAVLRISNLNQAMRYNFVFFGSCKDKGVGQVTNYVIGSEVARLDAKNNSQNMIQINNVHPDLNGNVFITINAAIVGGFGYLNSLSIQAIPISQTEPGISGRYSNSTLNNHGATEMGNDVFLTNGDVVNSSNEVAVTSYPNPFVDNILLRISLKKRESRLAVVLKDFSGNVLFNTNLFDVPAGDSQYNLKVNGRSLPPGIYGLQVITMPGGRSTTIKVVR